MPTNAQLLLLDRDVVAPSLTADQVMAAVRDAFVLHSQRAGRVFPVVRTKLHTGGVFGIKSGDVASRDLLGFKAAGFWPANPGRGGEPHQATIALFDPHTGRLTRLFNPRQDLWPEHFRYDGPVIVGLTDVGRTTVVVLAINQAHQVAARQALIDEGIFPRV